MEFTKEEISLIKGAIGTILAFSKPVEEKRELTDKLEKLYNKINNEN